MYVVMWDDEEDRDFAQVCSDDDLNLFLDELVDLYNDAKNIRIHALGKKIGQLATIYLKGRET